MAEQGFRITYATLSADNEELHAGYERRHRGRASWLGQNHPLDVNGEARWGSRARRRSVRRSTATRRSASSLRATREDVRDAVAAAKAAFPEWATARGRSGSRSSRKAADLISEQRDELAALMAMEVGKNRLEALGDVEESADLIRYYCRPDERARRVRDADGRGSARARSLRRPAAVRRLGGDQPVQLPDGAVGRADCGARSSPATPWCSSRASRACSPG